jgi:predicted MPP superfamily phosphohydrolase
MKIKKLFLITVVLISGSLSNFATNCAYAGSDTMRFVIMGDRMGSEQKGKFAEILAKMNLLKPDMVISVGDNIKGYTSDANIINAQWDEYDKLISRLETQFWTVTGNHDNTTKEMAAIRQKRYGSAYFYKLYDNVLFLFLNTQDPDNELSYDIDKVLNEENEKLKKMIRKQGYSKETMDFLERYEARQRQLNGGNIGERQFEYFKKILDENKNVKWTFVLMHKPMWKKGNPSVNWLNLEKMLASRPYTVIAGHEHKHQYMQRNGRDYIIMGTCGGGWIWPKNIPGIYNHILMITMTDKRPEIASILTDAITEKSDIRAIYDSNEMK